LSSPLGRDDDEEKNMSIRTYSTLSLLFAGAFALAPKAHASYVETFTGGSNVGGWAWGFEDSNPPTGGNPDAYLANESLDTFSPWLTTTFGASSPFVGDLRAAGVTGMSFDLRVDHTDFNTGGDGFHVSLLLIDTHGTDDNVDDDDYAWLAAGEIPAVGAGWAHYNFAMDVNSDSLSGGWVGGHSEDPTNFRAGVSWGDLITNVDQVRFSLLRPDYSAIFQNWSVGADNVAVATGVVPEPATMATLALGALVVLRRRRSGR
jgi:hypothetical protein